MNDLFSAAGVSQPATNALARETATANRPLADLLRPQALADVIGQSQLLGEDGSLTRLVRAGRLPSLIFWGPPGVGKTTIARLLAQEACLAFEPLSAVFSGVADLRKVFDRARERHRSGQGTLLFVDEIHRFNRAQQDGFLPFIEEGIVTLVGATTENPSFELNGALLSRAQVFVLRRLDEAALESLLARAERHFERALPLDPPARALLIDMADGDGRFLLNLVEILMSSPAPHIYSSAELAQILQKRAPIYDKNREEHYNLISALHKSVRASDPDAALYWLARMLNAGEDPLFLARRLVRMASEDIGLADPTALMIAIAARDSFAFLGSPDGELALAHATIHLACAPKSNAAYTAWKQAKDSARATGSLMPAKHSLNAPTRLMAQLGYQAGYQYDHDAEGGFSGQSHFPETMEPRQFYVPSGRGREKEIATRLADLASRRHHKPDHDKD